MPRFHGARVCDCALLIQLACAEGDETRLEGPRIHSMSAPLRDITAQEAMADLEQLFALVRTFYAPGEYKEARFGYSIAGFEDEARARLAADATEDGFYASANWFLSRFEDGHLNLIAALASNPVVSYDIGLFLTPVEGRAFVAEIDPALADVGVAYGDEVLAVDGVPPFTLLEAEISKVENFGNPLTNQHLVARALSRPGYAANLRPRSSTAQLELRRADGSEYTLELIWRENVTQAERFVPAGTSPGLLEGGFCHGVPSTSTRALAARSRRSAHRPPSSSRRRRPLPSTSRPLPRTQRRSRATDCTLARCRTSSGRSIHTTGGRSCSFVRAFTSPRGQRCRSCSTTARSWISFDDFVDGLVVDQTHNPGGSIQYCVDFARLFAQTPGENFVEAYNADRSWVSQLRSLGASIDPTLTSEEALRFALLAARVERAYDAGDSITQPFPLLGGNELLPDDAYVWTKPLLVLIDELAGSCGDIFPMLIKANHLAPLFGRRTIGLGGNVEGFGPLTNSQATLSLTRGLFTAHQDDGTYDPADFVENNGVQPDIEHPITVADFRAGFVAYMTHFSDVIAEQIVRAEANRARADE